MRWLVALIVLWPSLAWGATTGGPLFKNSCTEITDPVVDRILCYEQTNPPVLKYWSAALAWTPFTGAGAGVTHLNGLLGDVFVLGTTADISVTTASPNITLDLINTAVTPGSYGDATHVSQVTFDAKGRATAAVSVLIAGAAPGGPCGGDLGGTFPNCDVLKVHGVTYPASPSTNTVPVVTGANTVTYEAVPNAALAFSAMTFTGAHGLTSPGAISLGGTVAYDISAGGIANDRLTNSSLTIGTTTISLGGTSLTLAGLTSVTSTTFVGALTGNASTASASDHSPTACGANTFAQSQSTVWAFVCAHVDLSSADATGILAAARFPALTGDGTTVAGALAFTLVNIPTHVTMAGDIIATAIATPSTPAAGKGTIFVNSASKNFAMKNDAGTVVHGIQSNTGTSHTWVHAINDDGSVNLTAPDFSDLTGILLAGQLPALTGDVTMAFGGFVTVLKNIPSGVTVAVGSDATGDTWYRNSSGIFTRLAAVATGSLLASAGTSTAPAWSASPTLTTSLTTPVHIGGTGTTSTLELRATSGSGTTGADVIVTSGSNGGTEIARFFKSGSVAIGTTTAAFDGNSSIFLTLLSATAHTFSEFGMGGNATNAGDVAGSFAFFNSSLGATDKRVAVMTGVTDGATNGGKLTLFTYNAGAIAAGLVIDHAQAVSMPGLASSSVAQTGTVCWTTGGNLTVDTTTSCLLSSRRFKEREQLIDKNLALQAVLAMKPSSFYYRQDMGLTLAAGEQIGLMAEDMAEIDDRLASRDVEGRPIATRYQQAEALIVGAVQALKAENDRLRLRVELLEAKR